MKSISSEKKGVKWANSAIVWVMALALCLVYLTGSIQFTATNEGLYHLTFKQLDSQKKIGLNDADFEAVTKQLVDYVGLKTETFSVPVTWKGQSVDFFNDKERAHMKDVRSLFRLNNVLLKGSVAVVLLLWALGRFGLKQKQGVWEALYRSGPMLLLFSGIIGVLASRDFTAVFIKFHELFFSNELWLLDPTTDRMIVLLEEQFFSSLALYIGVFAVLAGVAGTLAGGLVLRKLNKSS